MILAIDPGYTTGTCLADHVDFDASTFNVIACVEVDWRDRALFFRATIEAHRDRLQAIVIEQFKLTNEPKALAAQYKSEMPSSRIIGLVEGIAYCYGIQDRIVFQEPWQRTQTRIPVEHRQLAGLSRHNQDAYKHLRYYVLSHRKQNDARS
jgi:hypothetical protein